MKKHTLKRLGLTALVGAMGLAAAAVFNPSGGRSLAQDKPQINWESLYRPHWSAEEQANAKIVGEFVQTMMNAHDFEAIRASHQNSPYIQHNQAMEDGIEGVLKYLEELTQSYPEYSYDVQSITADGDLVTLHSHVTLKAEHRKNQTEGFVIFDTWRVQEGKVIEHWDAVQPLDPFMRFIFWIQGGAIKNTNGLF